MVGHPVQSFGEVAADETAHRARPNGGGRGSAHAGNLVSGEAAVEHAVPVEILLLYVAVVDVCSVDAVEGSYHHQSCRRDGDVVDAALVVAVYGIYEEETLSPAAYPHASETVFGQRVEVVDLYALTPDIERHLLSVAPNAVAACGQPSMVLAVSEATKDRGCNRPFINKGAVRRVVGIELVVFRHHHQLPLRVEIEIAHKVGPVALLARVNEIKDSTVVRGCETDHTGIFHAHPNGSRAVGSHIDDIVRGDDGIAVSGSVVVDVACGIVIDEESTAVGANIVFTVVSLDDGEDGVALLGGFQSGYEVELPDRSFLWEYP